MKSQFKLYLNTVASISDKDFEASIYAFNEISLKKGEFFARPGLVCKYAAYIVSGMLRTFQINEKGEDISYCFCTENNFTTSFKSFISQTESTLSIQALENTKLLVIEYNELQKLYEKFPVWQNIGRVLVEKEYLVMEKYASILNNETAKEKYLRLMTEQPAIIKKAEIQHIASYLGISRETLSRIRNQVANSIL
jgi:CRP-like cAMP-binding protein